jgi:drug/metabolite transporter (DMT)-like permease
VSPRPRIPSLPALAWVSLATVYVLWGSTYLGIRVAIETLPPMLMAGTRFVIAGGLLYAFAVRRGDRADRPTSRHWLSATLIGGALMLGGNGGVVWAEQHIASGTAALLVATVPLWMALFAWLFLRERIPAAAVAGIVVGFAGTALLVGEHSGGGSDQLLGGLAVVGAAMSWTAGSLYARRAPLPRRPLVGAAMEMIGGGVLMLVVGAIAGEPGRLHLDQVTLRSLLGWGHLIVFGSVVAFSAYMWLLHNVPTQVVSTYAYVNPVVAVLLGWAFLAEDVTTRTLLAGGVIVASVALIVSSRRSPAPKREPVPLPAPAATRQAA